MRPSQKRSQACLVPARWMVMRCSRASLLFLDSLSLEGSLRRPFQVVMASANYIKSKVLEINCALTQGGTVHTWKFWLFRRSTLRMAHRGKLKPLPLGPPPWV